MYNFFYNWDGLNKTLFIHLNQLTNIYPLPQILYLFSKMFFIGNFAIIYIIYCIYFYIKIKNLRNKEIYFQNIFYELVRIGIIYTIFGLTFTAFKFLVNMPRPFCSLPLSDFITIADIAKERCLSSFPSAHTGLCILVTYVLHRYLNWFLKILMYGLVLIVATSRITLAMHYPADIIYSALVTINVIILGNLVYFKLHNQVIKPIGNLLFSLIFTEEKL
ncbi:MAG: phosphatase PAP2 family protein [Rickettsiales bacterium]|nr:MAG: phosphatase PAP2 family protein [Rickettsiales bacterium]